VKKSQTHRRRRVTPPTFDIIKAEEELSIGLAKMTAGLDILFAVSGVTQSLARLSSNLEDVYRRLCAARRFGAQSPRTVRKSKSEARKVTRASKGGAR
jgi:hypothetical protein